MDGVVAAALPYFQRTAAHSRHGASLRSELQVLGPHAALAGARETSATVGDYFALLKPRVMSLVLFTALAGLIAAPGEVHPLTAFTGLLCIALGAGAAGALNMAYDSDIDAVMSRTVGRPIPRGAVARSDAYAFGSVLAVASVTIMGLLVNYFAAALLAFTIFFYFFIYTAWLKRRTPQNIVIGGLAGSLPPAIGWAVVTGDVSLPPIVLVGIIFLWTPPHFWALSLYRADDYARARIPMLPVVWGKHETRKQILLYSVVLVAAGTLPAALGFAGILYFAASVGLGLWFLILGIAVYRERDEVREPHARRLFGVSILYLFVLFAALIAENLLGVAPFGALFAG
jgi:protoheme IX farnesyltransferase